MIYHVYSIFDAVQNNFQANLMLAVNDEDAKRNFSALVNSPGTIYNMFPTDFKLYKLASYNLHEGTFDESIPAVVCNGGDVLARKKEGAL